MRAVAVVLLLLGIVGAVTWMFRIKVAPPPIAGGPGPAHATQDAGGNPSTNQGPKVASPTPQAPATASGSKGLSHNTVATRVDATPAGGAELAATPTAWLRVRDRGAPIEGAAIRSVQGGVEIAFTDADGMAALPLTRPEQMAVVADGYLVRLAPVQMDSTASAPQDTQLVRDQWSYSLRVRCSGSTAELSNGVWVQLRLLDPPGTNLGPTSDDAVVKRAWHEHNLLASLPVGRELPIEDGVARTDRVHRLGADGEISFVTAGTYLLTAATPTGLVAQREVVVPAGSSGGRSEVSLALTRGATLRGRVAAPDGQGIAGATLQPQAGDPLGLVATTAPDGTFELGPLGAGAVTLHVRHMDHESLAFGPVASGEQGAAIVLQPLPSSVVRGRVRSRPDLVPIAAAVVTWSVPGNAPVIARTDAQGRFVLRATGSVAARLQVQAQGYVPYAELIEPGAAFADYDVLPAVPEVRAQKGLSTLLCGAVTDARGQPQVGVVVRWVPDAVVTQGGFPGRRTLAGALLDLPGLTTTGLDGAFVLETNHFGDGRICLPDDVAAPKRGLRVQAVAGETRNGLQLRR